MESRVLLPGCYLSLFQSSNLWIWECSWLGSFILVSSLSLGVSLLTILITFLLQAVTCPETTSVAEALFSLITPPSPPSPVAHDRYVGRQVAVAGAATGCFLKVYKYSATF